MISIELIRKEPELVKKRLSLKDSSLSLEIILELDKEYRLNLSRVNDLRSKRNKASEDIAKAKKAGLNTDKEIVSSKINFKILNNLNFLNINYLLF